MAVWTEGVGGLVLLRTFHYEALGVSVTVDEDDGVACFQLRKSCTCESIMSKQAKVANFGGHAELRNFAVILRDITWVAIRLLDDRESEEAFYINATQHVGAAVFDAVNK